MTLVRWFLENPLILIWLVATLAAAGVFAVQVGAYGRAEHKPITLESALWLGGGQATILFGALMVSFGAPDIAEEFGITSWWAVVVNHTANIGVFVGLVIAAMRGSIPRRMPMLLAIAGVAIAVPVFVHGAWVPITVLALAVYGAFAAVVFSAHTRVVANVRKEQRGAAVGLIMSFCLLGGVALVGVPLLGGWRVGLGAIAVATLLLAAAYPLWKGAPQWTEPQWKSLGAIVELARGHRTLLGGVAMNFCAWTALYTIPSLAGASSDIVVIMAVVAQLIAAALTYWAGRRSDASRRRVGIEAAFALGLGLAGVAVALTWPVLTLPVMGSTLGVWLAVAFFTIGEYGGNVSQTGFEAALSLAGGDDVREQLAGLALRFLTVGLGNMALGVLSGVLASAGVSGSWVGLVLGLVCAAFVGLALARPLSKLPNTPFVA